MPSTKLGTDRRGVDVQVGSYLVDDRGFAYQVVATDGTILKQNVVNTTRVGTGRTEYVRLVDVLVVHSVGSTYRNKEVYWALHREHVSPKLREELRQRKRWPRKLQ